MKRFLAIMLAAMLVLCSSLTAFAEDTDSNANQPPQMGDRAPEGQPPEPPEGGFPGGPGSTPPKNPMANPAAPVVLVVPAARTVLLVTHLTASRAM